MNIFEPPFIVIPMPINQNGKGPEMDETKVVKTLWEIWDATCRTVGIYETEEEAILARGKLGE